MEKIAFVLLSLLFAAPLSAQELPANPVKLYPSSGKGTASVVAPGTLCPNGQVCPDGVLYGVIWDGGHCRHDAWYDLRTTDENGNPRIPTEIVHYGNAVEFPNDCPGDADWPSFPYYDLGCLTQVPTVPGQPLLFNEFHVKDCEVDVNNSLLQVIPIPKSPGTFKIYRTGKRTIIHPNQCLQGDPRPVTCEEAMGLIGPQN